MEEKIRANIRKFREEAGLTQKNLADRIGKSESAVQAYEAGKTDIPLSALVAIAAALKISVSALERGSREERPAENPLTEILIYNQEDRLNTAAILIKNGYTVEQGKRPKTANGKALDYFLKIRKYSDGADTSR